jgi:predicted dehydrogenase
MRLGIVGCGAIALQGHLPAVTRLRAVDELVVVDADPEWVRQVGKRFGASRAICDYRELVGAVDVAIVATPNWTHVEIATYLLQHGIHVLCEKPVGLSAAEAACLFDLAARAGTRLMAGHSRRFTDSALALHRLMALGVLGHVKEATAALGVPMHRWPARDAFRADPRLAGGGCLMDSGVHLIDLVLWLFDEAWEVEDYRASGSRLGVEDDATLVLRFESGTRARLACSYSHDLSGVLDLKADYGWAKLPINGTPGLEFVGGTTPSGRSAGALMGAIDGTSAYERQLRHFLDCVRANEPFLVRAAEVVAGLRVVEECYARLAS